MFLSSISCGICKIAGACRKKVEKHVQRLHNIDQSELANHIETKEDPEIEQWVSFNDLHDKHEPSDQSPK